MSKRRRIKQAITGLAILAISAFAYWFYDGTRAVGTQEAAPIFVRYENPTRIGQVLNDLEKRGIIKSALATHLLALIERKSASVTIGTYSVGTGMNSELILRQLHKPVRQIVRLPETNWANRTANLLEQHKVTDAADYMALVHNPQEFANDVSFPLPKDSLEGYLYPDSYDLPPLYGARRVILKQLKNFEKRIWLADDKPKNLQEILTLASLVQLEAGTDRDRPMIAGVIENRIQKKMPLQIDATILYALQKWRRLTYKDYHTVKSAYNTYLVKGLPPGPICSPDEKDIEAALHPAKHDFLYYVALPNGTSIYAATYKDHLKNIQLMKAARGKK